MTPATPSSCPPAASSASRARSSTAAAPTRPSTPAASTWRSTPASRCWTRSAHARATSPSRCFPPDAIATRCRHLSQTGSRPAEDLDPHPLRVEDEERVVTRFVAILLRREVNPRPAGHASLVGGVHVLPALDLEGEVLDTDVVVGVGPAVGRAQANPAAVVRVNQVDDLL